MVPASPREIDERVARLRPTSANGAAGQTLDADDLDWVLYHSFPGSEVDPARLVPLLRVYERALTDGLSFDVELLYVRVLELGDAVPAEVRESLAHAAAHRALQLAFHPADAIASIRFVVRAQARCGEFLRHLLEDSAADRLRFDLTVDYLLDPRELQDYLALSYLREGDPDAERALAPFPISPDARAWFEDFYSEAACRRRVLDGWAAWADREERSMLSEALRSLWPGFAPEERG